MVWVGLSKVRFFALGWVGWFGLGEVRLGQVRLGWFRLGLVLLV